MISLYAMMRDYFTIQVMRDYFYDYFYDYFSDYVGLLYAMIIFSIIYDTMALAPGKWELPSRNVQTAILQLEPIMEE
jgi:hypothetical protein